MSPNGSEVRARIPEGVDLVEGNKSFHVLLFILASFKTVILFEHSG